MTAALERKAVGTLLSGWTATQISWPNVQFTPPSKAAWIAVAIRSGEASQIELGSDRNIHRHPGLVIVQVFVPADWGDKTALDLADSVAALFRRQRVEETDGSIVFRTPAIRVVGREGAFFQVNVSIPFVRDYLF